MSNNTELYKLIKDGYPGRECALDKEEWQLEQLIYAVRDEESTLIGIGILRKGYQWIYMKSSTLDEVIGTHIGEKGTPRRDKFEKELKDEIEKEELYVPVGGVKGIRGDNFKGELIQEMRESESNNK
jgi:hypothetical protein